MKFPFGSIAIEGHHLCYHIPKTSCQKTDGFWPSSMRTWFGPTFFPPISHNLSRKGLGSEWFAYVCASRCFNLFCLCWGMHMLRSFRLDQMICKFCKLTRSRIQQRRSSHASNFVLQNMYGKNMYTVPTNPITF